MSADIADLRELVNAGLDDDLALQQCLTFGQDMVAQYTRDLRPDVVPQSVLNEAVLTAAADQFNRRKAPNGVVNQMFDGGAAVRVNRDPLASVRPILRPWINDAGSAGSARLIRH